MDGGLYCIGPGFSFAKMKIDYKGLLEEIKRFFKDHPQTAWGKNQIILKITELEAEFYERAVIEK